MKFLLWLLGLFALAVVLVQAAHNPGYVLLVYPPYRIEMSLTLFVLLLLALFVLGYFTVRLVLSARRGLQLLSSSTWRQSPVPEKQVPENQAAGNAASTQQQQTKL